MHSSIDIAFADSIAEAGQTLPYFRHEKRNGSERKEISLFSFLTRIGDPFGYSSNLGSGKCGGA